MPVGRKDPRGVAMAIAVAGRRHEPLDLGLVRYSRVRSLPREPFRATGGPHVQT